MVNHMPAIFVIERVKETVNVAQPVGQCGDVNTSLHEWGKPESELTAWIQALAQVIIAKNWEKGKSLYLRQIMGELDPDGSANLDAGTLRKELEALVFQGSLTKNQKRIVDEDRRARKVVCYEPSANLLQYHDSFH